MFWRSKGVDPAAPWPRRDGRGSSYRKPSRHFTKPEESSEEEVCEVGSSRSVSTLYHSVDVPRSVKRLHLSLEPRLYPPPKRQKACAPPTCSQVPKGAVESELWTEKYRPENRDGLVGNQKLITRLYSWLQTWQEGKRLGASNFKRAVLISGPSGVGKTAAAIAVSKELEFSTVWSLASTLKVDKTLLNNQGLTRYGSSLGLCARIVFIVDEMDHLDEQTIQALFSLLKRGSFPVICICNDRYGKSIRKILAYCMELKFQRPKAGEILKLLLGVQRREKMLLGQEVLEMLIENAQRDVRQALLQMQYLCIGTNTHQRNVRINAKDKSTLSPFAAVESLFAEPGSSNFQPFEARVSFILQDFEFVSLLVQENYINYMPAKLRKAALIMDVISKASDCLCFDDLMRRHKKWEQKHLRSAVLALTCSSVLQGRRTAFDDRDQNLRYPASLTKVPCVKKTSSDKRDHTAIHRKVPTVPEALPSKVSADKVATPRNIQFSDELFAILKHGQ